MQGKDISPSIIRKLVVLTEKVGQQVLSADRTATQKQDGTDITAADMLAHKLLTQGIREIIGKDVLILSEEDLAHVPDITRGLAFVIDPLDGTANFKENNRNFGILLAILQDGVPVYGVCVAPAYGLTACGGILTQSAALHLHARPHTPAVTPYRQTRQIVPIDNDAHGAVVPQRFFNTTIPAERLVIDRAMQAFKQNFNNVSFEGSAYILGSILPVLKSNIRYRLYEAVRPNQRPGDWDLAAWDAILRGVGGIMTDSGGRELRYGRKEADYKHQNFICWRKADEARAFAARQKPSAPEPPKKP